MRKSGDRATNKAGRVYEWVSPGWWQPIYTDRERQLLASGKTPPVWDPTPAEIERAWTYARELIGG